MIGIFLNDYFFFLNWNSVSLSLFLFLEKD
jgi:hypothetical protein